LIHVSLLRDIVVPGTAYVTPIGPCGIYTA
jgi:hypothetical protein